MRRAVVLVGVAGAALLLSACPPPAYPNCNNDEHCKAQGQVCVQGQCQECATDANCKPGFVCQGNKCVPRPECTPGGNECGPGRRCENGKCVSGEAGRSGCSTDEDCPAGQKCQGGQCVTATASADCSFEPVHFEFNEASLTSDARSVLERIADCIKQQNMRLRLEGHADERGTEEYNLQLSNRRADAVRQFLVRLGVRDGALETIGYGETRPASNASSEDGWAQNRRVEFRR